VQVSKEPSRATYTKDWWCVGDTRDCGRRRASCCFPAHPKFCIAHEAN
jgi:hypothetical protein